MARPEEPAIAYEVALEPTGEHWLFGLDVVSSVPQGARLNHSFALVADNRVNQRFSYRAASDPDFRIDTLSTEERDLALSLPDRLSDRVSRLVTSWQADTDPRQPLQLVRKALSYFREEPFVYTLTPGKGPESGDPIDRFLFETRRGFCEHYAGSFATLMRAAGIPSRVVVGYLGGEKNPHADHWVVRQSDAMPGRKYGSPRSAGSVSTRPRQLPPNASSKQSILRSPGMPTRLCFAGSATGCSPA
jgi:hypothetical protein